MPRKFWLWSAALAGAAVVAVLTALNPLGDTPLADRWRIQLTSAPVADDLATREYAAHLRDYATAGVLDSDPTLTEVVSSVAEPLVAAARDLYPQTRDWPWEWHLADTGEVNAWCLPEGRIMVLSGLLDETVLDDDRDRLATVLAHEVAHAVLHHSREGIGRAFLAQGLAWTVARSLKVGAMREELLTRTLKTTLLEPRRRMREAEADELGLELMARAGFAPDKAVETWERLGQRQDPASPSPRAQQALAFLTDHPSDAERLQHLRALLPQARAMTDRAQHWDWMTHGLEPEQSEALTRAANAFGLDGLTLANNRKLVGRVATAERVSPARAAAEIEQAMWETALEQGGALQMGLSAMVRSIGGWERLARVEQAWSKLRRAKPLMQDSDQIKRMALSTEDREVALATVRRLTDYLAAPRTQRRLWRDAAEHLGPSLPKGRQAILDNLGDLP